MATISSLLTGKRKVHEHHIKMICEYFEIGEKKPSWVMLMSS